MVWVQAARTVERKDMHLGSDKAGNWKDESTASNVASYIFIKRSCLSGIIEMVGKSLI